MSMKAIRRTWKEASIGGRPLVLLLRLATIANDKGEVAVLMKDLQHQSRLNDEQARGALEQLITTKHIKVKWPEVIDGKLECWLFPDKGWQVQR